MSSERPGLARRRREAVSLVLGWLLVAVVFWGLFGGLAFVLWRALS